MTTDYIDELCEDFLERPIDIVTTVDLADPEALETAGVYASPSEEALRLCKDVSEPAPLFSIAIQTALGNVVAHRGEHERDLVADHLGRFPHGPEQGPLRTGSVTRENHAEDLQAEPPERRVDLAAGGRGRG